MKKVIYFLVFIFLVNFMYADEGVYNEIYNFTFNSTPFSITKILSLYYYNVTNPLIKINTSNKYINLTNVTFYNTTNVSLEISIFINQTINDSDVSYIYYYNDSVLDYIYIITWNFVYFNLSTLPQPEFRVISDTEYLLTINQSALPYFTTYGHLIEAQKNSNITVVCDGFLKCPEKYYNGENELFNFTFNISIPQDVLGYFNDYIILFVGDKIVKINWNFNITTTEEYYQYIITEKDIANCVRDLGLSIIECINMLVNKSSTTIINRTIYRNNTVEVPVPVIKWDYETINQLFSEKNKTDAAILALADERSGVKSLNDRITNLEGRVDEYQDIMLQLDNIRLQERVEYDRLITIAKKKKYIPFWIIGIIIISYFILNLLYKAKMYSSHSLIKELYFTIRRVV